MKTTEKGSKVIKFPFQFINLGEEKSTETVVEAKDLISNEEPERFENDVQVDDDDDEGKFNFRVYYFLIIINLRDFIFQLIKIMGI